MQRRRPLDIDEQNAAFDRIDALLANASNPKVELGAVPRESPRAFPPVERILAVLEELLLVRVALERDGIMTPAVRQSMDQALSDVSVLCDEWGFATARVRVDFMVEDLRRGCGDLKNDITELVRHLRYDARSGGPRLPRAEHRYSTHGSIRANAADAKRPV